MTKNDGARWFVVCDVCGRRYCQDKRYREHAHLGNTKECVKFYKYAATAQKIAWRHTCPCVPKHTTAKTKALYPGDTFDAAGNITRNAVPQQPKKKIPAGKERVFKIEYLTRHPHSPEYYEDENIFRRRIIQLREQSRLAAGFEFNNGHWLEAK